MWNVIAISMALNRPGFMGENDRKDLQRQLADVQESLELYFDWGDGGWNTYPNQTDFHKHITYTAALGLLMCIELHDANLPWRGEFARRDLMLSLTAHWLMQHWQPSADSAGWRAAEDDEAPVSDGLTLQIYSEYLRAEAESGLVISTPILEDIPRHLLRLEGRPFDYPSSVGRFGRAFRNHKAKDYNESPAINYFWHPWAVETVRLWLKRMETHPAPYEQRTQMRRIFGYLVVNLGRDLQIKASSGPVPPFIAGETVYAYSRIPALREAK